MKILILAIASLIILPNTILHASGNTKCPADNTGEKLIEELKNEGFTEIYNYDYEKHKQYSFIESKITSNSSKTKDYLTCTYQNSSRKAVSYKKAFKKCTPSSSHWTTDHISPQKICVGTIGPVLPVYCKAECEPL